MDRYGLDGTKIGFHPHRVAAWLDARDDWALAKSVYPLYVEVSPIGACNHRCTFCAVDYIGYKAVRLSAEVLRDRFAEMASLGVKSIMLAGEGEPLLHTEIDAIVRSAVDAGLDVAITTNGVLLHSLETLPLCTWVKVSLNAGTRETYAKVHRTKPDDFNRVLSNLRAAVERKGNCTLGIQMVVLPENEHEINRLRAIGTDIGVDYVVAKPYSQHKFSITSQYEGFAPEIADAPGLTVRHEAFDTHGFEYSRCHATPFLWAYVMATGDVYSCSAYLLDERFRLGNLNTESFRDIWEGARRKAHFNMMRGHDISECRVNCRMDKSNRFLERMQTQEHANFI